MRIRFLKGHGPLSRARIRNVLLHEHTSKPRLGGKYCDKEGLVVAGAHTTPTAKAKKLKVHEIDEENHALKVYLIAAMLERHSKLNSASPLGVKSRSNRNLHSTILRRPHKIR